MATVSPNRWSESASVHFYCDDDSHVHQPTPEEIAANEAYEQRTDTYEVMQGRIVEFAKGVLPKFPAKSQTKLRQWTHEAFEAAYECAPQSHDDHPDAGSAILLLTGRRGQRRGARPIRSGWRARASHLRLRGNEPDLAPLSQLHSTGRSCARSQ